MRFAKTDVPVSRERPPGSNWILEMRAVTGRWPLGEGTDIAPLLKGRGGDLCQSPHWGYLIEGEVTVAYGESSEETVKGGDLFYWPAGHTGKLERMQRSFSLARKPNTAWSWTI